MIVSSEKSMLITFHSCVFHHKTETLVRSQRIARQLKDKQSEEVGLKFEVDLIGKDPVMKIASRK